MQVCIVKLQEIKKMRQEGRLGANGSASAAGLIVPKKRLVCVFFKGLVLLSREIEFDS